MASATVAKLNVHLGLNAQALLGGLKQSGSALQGFASQFSSIQGMLAGAFAGVGAAGALGWGVKLAAEAQTAQVAFEVMLGSGDKAAAMLKDIKQFAAATPFGAADLRDAAKTMLAFGIAADQIMPNLKMLGDIAAGDAQKLSSLSLVFGQIASAGRLTGGDLLQLINVGFNPLQEIAKSTGKTMAELRDDMSNGKISFDMVKEAFVKATSAGGQFNGMMDKMSQTAAGKWSTLKDQFAELAVSIGEKLLPIAVKGIDMMSAFIDVLLKMDATVVENVVKLGTFVTAFAAAVYVIPKIFGAIRTLIAMYKALTIAQSIQQALSGPKGWAVLAASLAIAAGAAFTVSKMFEKSNETLVKTTKEAAKATDAVKQLNTELGAGGKTETLVSSADRYAEAMARAKENLDGQARSAREIRENLARGNQPVAAMQFGTQAAISAVAAAQREQKLQIEVDKQILAENKAATLRLKNIEAVLRGQRPVEVKEVVL